MKYTDYFNLKTSENEISMDEFIAEATRADLILHDEKTELSYLRTARITLTNEIFTCYEFLKERNLLNAYHIYRDGF